ncbi:MAG: hypothetical protein GY906_25320 [bacterium]|nr:hypothetical protein [bacterium]
MPPPSDSQAPAFHLWSDSTLSLKYLKNGGATKPKYGAFAVSKAITECCGLAASTAEAVTSGGTVVELLAFLRRLVDAKQMAKEIAYPEEVVIDTTLVVVWSFNDFFTSDCKLRPTLSDAFYETFASVLGYIRTNFSRSVFICGGDAETWNAKSRLYDTYSSCVREKLRAAGALVVNPTDLFNGLPRKDAWHFL